MQAAELEEFLFGAKSAGPARLFQQPEPEEEEEEEDDMTLADLMRKVRKLRAHLCSHHALSQQLTLSLKQLHALVL